MEKKHVIIRGTRLLPEDILFSKEDTFTYFVTCSYSRCDAAEGHLSADGPDTCQCGTLQPCHLYFTQRLTCKFPLSTQIFFHNYLRFKSSRSGTTTFFCMICSSPGVKSTLWCLLSSTGCTSIFYVRYKGVYISCATYCNVDIVNVNASGHFMPFCTDIRKGETGNGGSGPNVLKYRDKVFYCKVWIKNIILYNYTDKSVTSIKINICLKTPHQAMSL